MARPEARRWLLLLAPLCACSFDARFDDTHYQCRRDGDCPSGAVCLDGLCTEDRDGAADSDAGACLPASELVDDFINLAAWQKLGESSECVLESLDGELRLFKTTETDPCGVRLKADVDFYDDRVTLEAVEAGDGEPKARMEIGIPEAGWYGIGRHAATDLVAYVRTGSTFTEIDRFASDPQEDLYWGLRVDGDTLYWETAPDGVDWTVQASTAFDHALLAPCSRIQLMATDAPAAVPEALLFDHLGLVP